MGRSPEPTTARPNRPARRPSAMFGPPARPGVSGFADRRASLARMLGAMVALGVAWRVARFAAGPSLWGDEAFLAVSLLTRDFAGLLRPLEYHQIAPLGFLGAELAVVRALGSSEWALRLIPFVAGLLSLALFARFAKGAVDRRSALMAVGIFAASFYPVRHATEVKPYATDLLLSLVTTGLAWSTWRDRRSIRRWLTLAAAVAAGVWFSYPLVFVAAGVGLVLGAGAIRDRDARSLLGLGLFGLTTAASWAVSYVAFARPQSLASPFYRQLKTWQGAFPPWGRPRAFPAWLLDVHTGNMLAYPNGGNNFGSAATAVLVVAGGVALARARPALLALLLSPLLPTFLAASLGRYPYGTSARTSLYMAPAFCLLAGVGLVALIRRFQAGGRRARSYRLATIALGAMAVVGAVVNVVQPWKNREDHENRRAVRELAAMARPGDRWLAFDGLAAGLPDDLPGLMLEHWLQQMAEVRYNLLARAPVPLAWNPGPVALAAPARGRTWLIVHRSGCPGFDEAGLAADREALGRRLGRPATHRFPLTRGESIEADEYPAPAGERANWPGRMAGMSIVSRVRVDASPRLEAGCPSDVDLARATWAFVALGVTIRLVRLLLVHPLWGDECFVAANLIDRGYLDLLRPLDYQQVAPVLFLWAELSAVRCLGFSEWSLRVFPTACAIGSLFLFRHSAGRVLRGRPLLFAVAILAVSVNPVRHSGEAKPYASDFFVALALLAIVIEWWREPGRSRWIWALTMTTPFALGLSLPAVFVAGGIALAMLGPVARGRRPGVIAAYLAYGLALVAGFAAVLKLHSGGDSAEVRAYMDHYWAGFFPPLGSPPALAWWLVKAHTGFLFAYPVGGAMGASVLTAACVCAGAVDLRRRGQGPIVAACLAPLGLALGASALHRYPYGESERLMQFAGPMACLLAGAGAAALIGRLRRPGATRRSGRLLVGACAAIGLGTIAVDLVHPGKSIPDLRAREFARWFWAEAGVDAELACARVDLGLDFEPGPSHHGRSADYLSYQRIYSERRRKPRPLDWRSLSPAHPLRCVLYDGVPADSPLFERWMAGMAAHYRLERTTTYRVNSGIAPRGVTSEDHLAVLEFVPRGEPVDPVALAERARAATRGRSSTTAARR